MLVGGGFFAGFSIRFQIKLRIDYFECHLEYSKMDRLSTSDI